MKIYKNILKSLKSLFKNDPNGFKSLLILTKDAALKTREEFLKNKHEKDFTKIKTLIKGIF